MAPAPTSAEEQAHTFAQLQHLAAAMNAAGGGVTHIPAPAQHHAPPHSHAAAVHAASPGGVLLAPGGGVAGAGAYALRPAAAGLALQQVPGGGVAYVLQGASPQQLAQGLLAAQAGAAAGGAAQQQQQQQQ